MLEAPTAGRPGVERAERARLPHRDLVALAELRGRVAVQLQRLGQRRRRVRPQRAVPGAEVAISLTPPILTEWWFRPVRSAWRVGEQSAVVWKRL